MLPSLSNFRRNNITFPMNYGVTLFSVRNLVEGMYYVDFCVWLPSKGKTLQRELVWTLFQKQELILSILRGRPIPTFKLIKVHTPSIFQMVDGKQRLSSILAFVQDEFCISIEGQDYLFSDLPEDYKKAILHFQIVADLGYDYPSDPITDQEKIDWFDLLNFSGTPQDIEHMKSLKES